MFWLRNIKNNFPVRTLIWRPDLLKTISAVSAHALLFLSCNCYVYQHELLISSYSSGTISVFMYGNIMLMKSNVDPDLLPSSYESTLFKTRSPNGALFIYLAELKKNGGYSGQTSELYHI